MWKIKHIFDGEYGCEELATGAEKMVSVTLVDENERTKIVSVADEWLTKHNLDEGSLWPNRFVSIKDLELLGEGRHGKVYKLNDEQIIKVYCDDSTLDMIERERRNGKMIFVKGVPAAITFDVVETEMGYGVVFELANGQTLGNYMAEHLNQLDELSEEFAEILHMLHSAKADETQCESIKEFYRNTFSKIEEKYLSNSDKEALIRIVDAIPDAKGFIHNDYHTQNVIINDKKEMYIIDVAEICYGHYIFDLGVTYMDICLCANLPGPICKNVTGLSNKAAKRVWKKFLSSYLHTDDEKKIKYIEMLCKNIQNLRLATLLAIKDYLPSIVFCIIAFWVKRVLIAKESKRIQEFHALEN